MTRSHEPTTTTVALHLEKRDANNPKLDELVDSKNEETFDRKIKDEHVDKNLENPEQHLKELEEKDFDKPVERKVDPRVIKERENYEGIKYNGARGESFVINPKQLDSVEKEKFDIGWKDYAFNEYASSLIPLNRTLKDIRQEGCKTDSFSTDLPTASVIMCFHNEAWSVLLRGIYSVVNRSPAHFLKEILLVDDFSDFGHLLEPLDSYLYSEFGTRVRVLRNKKREGLIRSRLHGAREAKGEVLIFLDSHIEATPGWLEPLLQEVHNDKRTVVTPLIDILDKDTFAYRYNKGPKVSVGGFDWRLVFTWHTAPDEDLAKRSLDHQPVRSPTMAGGLFAISKEYFSDIGTYDAGMEIWGGENLEISFRIWMCGGNLVTVPCSRVGHVFRDRSPYKWKPGVNVLQKNNIRLAEVWLDEYKEIYYKNLNIRQNDVRQEHLKARKQLRKDLHCKSFQWYLNNIYPTMWNPFDSLYKGQLAAGNGFYCLDAEVNRRQINEGKPARVKSKKIISNQRNYQVWFYSKMNEIRIDGACLDYPGGKKHMDKPKKVITYPCHGSRGNQVWLYNEDKSILHEASQLCLKTDGFDLMMSKCDPSDPNQIWTWDKFVKPKDEVK